MCIKKAFSIRIWIEKALLKFLVNVALSSVVKMISRS